MTVHSQFRKGQKVLVILKDGERYVGKYMRAYSIKIELELRSFYNEDIRAISIYKQQDMCMPKDKLLSGVF